MTNLYKVYTSVHNSELKQEITESRDSVSEMNLSGMTDSDLVEISESIIEDLFTSGYSEDDTYGAVSKVFETFYGNVSSTHRKEKLERLSEAFNRAFDKVYSFAETNSTKAFIDYRVGKVISEKWNNKVTHEHGNERLHAALISEESHKLKSVLTKLFTDIVEKKDDSYLETDMKKRQKNNEKARKDMAKMGSMKNPHFEETNIRGNDSEEQKKRLEKKRGMKLDDHPQFKKEEVSAIRKDWGDAYSSIYEKKMDPVGQEDGDIDNDGDKDSSDKYLMKRRKAIGKAMGKNGKCEKCGKDPCECDTKKEGYMPMTPERTARVEKAKKKAYNMDMRAQAKGDTKEADKQFKRRMAMDSGTKMRKEEVVNEAAGGIIAGTTALMKGATAAKAVKGASLLSKGASLAGGLGSLARGVGAGAGIGNKAAAALGAAGGFGLAKATEKKKQQQESVFSQAELDRIEEIVNSWED